MAVTTPGELVGERREVALERLYTLYKAEWTAERGGIAALRKLREQEAERYFERYGVRL